MASDGVHARLISFLAASLLAGCTATYSRSEVAVPSTVLRSGGNVVIATPEDGSYGDKVYRDSGESTAAAVRAAFAHYTSRAVIVGNCADVTCLRQAPEGKAADYLVVPEILHWEDRNTEWSGIKDKLEIKLTVFDRESDAPVASAVINGKSKWATFGGDHPQDLLAEPVGAYVATLFGAPTKDR